MARLLLRDSSYVGLWMPVWWPGSREQLALSLWPSNGAVWWNVSLGRAWPGCASCPELGPGRWRRWPVVWVPPHSTLGSGSGLPLSALAAPRPCCLVFHSRSSPEAGEPTSLQALNTGRWSCPVLTDVGLLCWVSLKNFC